MFSLLFLKIWLVAKLEAPAHHLALEVATVADVLGANAIRIDVQFAEVIAKPAGQ